MKKILLLLLFTCLFISTQAQTFKEEKLTTKISEVTVFLQGAYVQRTGEKYLPKGRSILKVEALTPHMDSKSIQLKADGEFTILSVNHSFNYLDTLQQEASIDSMQALILDMEYEVEELQARLLVLEEKQSVLKLNKGLGSETAGVNMDELQQAIDLYDREFTSIKKEEIQIKRKAQTIEKKKTRIEKEIALLSNQDQLPTSEIEIRVDTKQATKGEFILSYQVKNAGWYPKYDVRVKSVEEPVEINYKAEVYQNTGINWDNVKLKFSNADPNKTGVAPALQKWDLNYERNTVYRDRRSGYGLYPDFKGKVSGVITDDSGYGLIGATVQVKGTSIGTVTDLDGRYELTLPNGAKSLIVSYTGFNAKEILINSPIINAELDGTEYLDEIVVTGALQGRISGLHIRGSSSIKQEYKKAKTITSTTIENQTTVEFVVDLPYSIKSNGEALLVDLKTFNIETLYEYFAVPKLDKDAFLIAKLIRWDQYNLLQGEANLYLEDAYVGRSIIDAKSLSDTLSLSLGRDKNIVIGREKIEEFSKRRIVGKNKIETRSFKITVRNKKSQGINITLFDQIPVPVINEIHVSEEELSNGLLDEKSGQVTWKLNIPAQQQQELILGYEVKYPKRELVRIE